MPRMLPHTATHCNTMQHTATHCNTLHCNILHLQHSAIQRIVIYYITLQHTATPGADTLHHTATPGAAGAHRRVCQRCHCNTLQHTATSCSNRGSRRASPCMPTMPLQHTASHRNTLQLHGQQARIIVYANDATATHCNILQHLATHCNNRGSRRASSCMPRMPPQPCASHRRCRYVLQCVAAC